MIDHTDAIKEYYPDIAAESRGQIIESIYKKKNHITFSHKIKGRWENQYLDLDFVPAVKDIFHFACEAARDISAQSVVVPYKALGFPIDEFWFNIAKPGESTGWHDHKENAALSAVYYLKVPSGSGKIQFRKKNKEGWYEWSLKSQTGKMILFNSNVEHAVGENNSSDDRISLAFNLYTLPLKLDMDSTGYSSNKFFF